MKTIFDVQGEVNKYMRELAKKLDVTRIHIKWKKLADGQEVMDMDVSNAPQKPPRSIEAHGGTVKW